MFKCALETITAADSWKTYINRPLQRLTNIIYINNAPSRRDRPHNIGITTLLFMIDVHGFFYVSR